MPIAAKTASETNSLSFRALSQSDIPAVQSLAQKIWRAHYAGIIPAAQMDYMLEWMYAPGSIAKQVEQGHRYTLALIGSEPVGYASVELQPDGVLQLHKLYVDTGLHQRGVGYALLNELVRLHGPRAMRLGVNRRNIRAINFYFRQGFTITATQDKDIGDGFVMEDFVMEKTCRT